MKLVLLTLLAKASLVLLIDDPKQRTFELAYVAEVDVPEGAERVQLWLPYPRRDDYQDVRLLSIGSPVPTKLYQEYTYRNSMLFISTPAAEIEQLRVEMSFRVSRREHVENDFAELEDPEGWIESSASRWLRALPAELLDDETRARAEELTEGKETVVEKARAIFDAVADEGSGACADSNMTFIRLAGAAGIPAKFQLGFPIPEARGEGEIGHPGCWAEFYVPGFGWVPVDVAAAREKPEDRDYFFGAHDANRVEVTLGRRFDLNPKQSGTPVDEFIYPYAEIDGKPADDVGYELFYKDLERP